MVALKKSGMRVSERGTGIKRKSLAVMIPLPCSMEDG